ncbi:PepSY domain-containing protein [Priestia abyssalis]|uniref:PepSY domain-containing protein n=1 Tax=Priestia abyssalis TaxID=1221450 RepID=UPI0009951BC7|nr:PepSY domain-containing protein [Priestia abyssalis]
MKIEFSKAQHLYKLVWRWHFYAVLIFTPVLLILAITGGTYLFKSQLEHHDDQQEHH